MKQLLINSLTSLVTGIFFAIGLAIVGIAVSNYYNNKNSTHKLENTNLPDGISIVKHSVAPNRPSFTILGSIKNTGKETWSQVSLRADIRAGNALVNQCNADVRGEFPPGAQQSFAIECYQVSGSNLPDNISYQLIVDSAWKGS